MVSGQFSGKIDDRAIEVLHTGRWRKRFADETKFLSATGICGEQDQQFDCLISAGFAGALNDDLQIGDLLLAENFSTVDLK